MQILQSKINKLALLILPSRLRSVTVAALLKTFVAPLEVLKGRFDKYRTEKAYWLGVTPQVCYLEKVLNDAFDPERRSIYITNTQGDQVILIHPNTYVMPVTLHKLDSNLPVMIDDNSSYADSGYDFQVESNDKFGLSCSKRLKAEAILNANKLPDKEYKMFI